MYMYIFELTSCSSCMITSELRHVPISSALCSLQPFPPWIQEQQISVSASNSPATFVQIMISKPLHWGMLNV